MDKILEGIFLSTHPDKLKEALVLRICDQALKPYNSESTVRSVLQVSCKWILHGPTILQVSSGLRLFSAWGSHNVDFFRSFFTPNLIAELFTLDRGMTANVPLLVKEGFRVMKNNGVSMYKDHARVVQKNITKFICSTQEQLVVRNVGLLLEEFSACIPSEESEVTNFCVSVIHHLSKGFFPGERDKIQKFIRCTDEIASFLSMMWNHHCPALLADCLAEVFRIISVPRTQGHSDTAICLASLVKYVPIRMVNKFVTDVVTDHTISDGALEAAITEIIEWLKWPTSQNVDLWLQCFVTELASTQKYMLQICITEICTKVFTENISDSILRQTLFKILSQVLLNFRQSPELFQKYLERMPDVIHMLREEGTSQSVSFLRQVSNLIHCLVCKHSGFPEIYGPILEQIKDFGWPSVELMQKMSEDSKWLAQPVSTAEMEKMTLPVLMTLFRHKKLEVGKTGLENLGNTCYMNSVIQALYMCDKFRISVLRKTPSLKESLLVKLQHVFAHLRYSDRPSIAPIKFLHASRPPWFLPGHQQDCSEFLKYLLDQLHEDEKSSSLSAVNYGSETIRMGNTLSTSERKQAMVTDTVMKMKTEEEKGFSPDCDRRTESSKSLVERTFRGKVQTTLRCLSCKQESSRIESFTDIPLAFPNSSRFAEHPHKILVGGSGVPFSDMTADNLQNSSKTDAEFTNPPEICFSLSDLISFYLKPEKLTGDNKYYCDKCGMLQDGEKSIRIIETPSYLILTLLRFSYDARHQIRTKIIQDVKYPCTFALPFCEESSDCTKSSLSTQYSQNSSPFTSTSNSGSTDSHATEFEDIAECQIPGSAEGCQLYSLCGVIVHSGTSSESGHYYCYARHSKSDHPSDTGLQSHDSNNLENVDFLPDKWYSFNDTQVSTTKFDSFSNVTKRFSNDTAYVLIYCQQKPGNTSFELDVDPILRSDLSDTVFKDNEAYHKEQEREARLREQKRQKKRASTDPSKFFTWHNRDDDDDDSPPGGHHSCGDGLGNDLDISGSRFVF